MTHVPEIQGLGDWRPLARGGLAVVWEARELASDRLVAVKVYQVSTCFPAAITARFHGPCRLFGKAL